MNKLTVFWGDRHAETFRWRYSGEQSAESSAIPQIESEELLKADLHCLAEMAGQAEVELILASEDVYFSQVTMPSKAQRHLRKAVPYILEEQLAEPVDKVFIALGKQTGQGEIPVRAINHGYLERIAQAFRKAEISLARVTVDLDRVSAPEAGVCVVLSEDKIYYVSDAGLRWACQKDDFQWLVQKSLTDETADEELPIAIPMQVVCDDSEKYEYFIQDLPVGRFAPQAVEVDSIYDFLVSEKNLTISFLQGEFEPKVEKSPYKKLLLKVASIAGLVLAAHLVFQISSWVVLENQIELLENQKQALWEQAFPGQRMKVNAKSIIRSRLRALEGGQGEDAFLPLLDKVSEQITDLEALYPTNISYNAVRNELRLDLIGKEYITLNNYRDALTSAGLSVEMNSATQRGEGYSSRFIITQ